MISAAVPYTTYTTARREAPRGLFSCPLSNTAQHRIKDPPRVAACILRHARGLFLTPMRAGAFIAGAVYYSTLKRTPERFTPMKKGAEHSRSHRSIGQGKKGKGWRSHRRGSVPADRIGPTSTATADHARRGTVSGAAAEHRRTATTHGTEGAEDRPRPRLPPSFGILHKDGMGCCCIYHPKRR